MTGATGRGRLNPPRPAVERCRGAHRTADGQARLAPWSGQDEARARASRAMGQLQLFVVGMSCRRCVREVTARLRDIPGVETVAANPADESVRLTGSMRYDDVRAALAGTEYTAHLAGGGPDSGRTGTGQTSQ